MNNTINALTALVKNYKDTPSGLLDELIELFDRQDDFLDKVKKFDKLFLKYTEFNEIQEYAFDLLMSHHLDNNQEDEDYFESREWMDIEDSTLERGTELLNMLLYITEANDNGVEMELGDFLNEFLLVDYDEFQDEHAIYEGLISNQELVEEDDNIIIEASRNIKADDELKDLILPLFLFFSDPEHIKPGVVLDKIKPVERAVYMSMMAYA